MNENEQNTPEDNQEVETQAEETEQQNEELEAGTAPEDENVGDDSVEAQQNEKVGWVKKRLSRQQKKHDKERQELQAQIGQLQQAITNPQVLQQVLNNANQGAQAQPTDGFQQPADTSTESIVRRVMQEAEEQKNLYSAQYQQQQAQVYQDAKSQSLDSDLEELYDKNDDLEELMIGTAFTSPMIEAAKMVPNGAKVLARIARSGDLAQKISRLQPYEMMHAMIEQSNKVATGVRQKTVSDAPEPKADARGSGGSSFNKSIRKMSQAEVDARFYPDG